MSLLLLPSQFPAHKELSLGTLAKSRVYGKGVTSLWLHKTAITQNNLCPFSGDRAMSQNFLLEYSSLARKSPVSCSFALQAPLREAKGRLELQIFRPAVVPEGNPNITGGTPDPRILPDFAFQCDLAHPDAVLGAPKFRLYPMIKLPANGCARLSTHAPLVHRTRFFTLCAVTAWCKPGVCKR